MALERVLAVDDEADFQATYARLLRRHGYDVVTAGTVGEAVAALAAGRFSLVIADLRLPDGNGIEVLRAARGAREPAPAVIVTAYPSPESRAAALAAGAAAFLAKPFSTQALSELVQRLVEPPAERR